MWHSPVLQDLPLNFANNAGSRAVEGTLSLPNQLSLEIETIDAWNIILPLLNRSITPKLATVKVASLVTDDTVLYSYAHATINHLGSDYTARYAERLPHLPHSVTAVIFSRFEHHLGYFAF